MQGISMIPSHTTGILNQWVNLPNLATNSTVCAPHLHHLIFIQHSEYSFNSIKPSTFFFAHLEHDPGFLIWSVGPDYLPDLILCSHPCFTPAKRSSCSFSNCQTYSHFRASLNLESSSFLLTSEVFAPMPSKRPSLPIFSKWTPSQPPLFFILYLALISS